MIDDGPHWDLLEDMITFLVKFGFEPRYVLSRDLLTLEGMYGSAMRCTYLDKSEDLISMACAISECMPRDSKKKHESLFERQLKSWAKITGAKAVVEHGADVVSKLQGLATQLAKKKSDGR